MYSFNVQLLDFIFVIQLNVHEYLSYNAYNRNILLQPSLFGNVNILFLVFISMFHK